MEAGSVGGMGREVEGERGRYFLAKNDRARKVMEADRAEDALALNAPFDVRTCACTCTALRLLCMAYALPSGSPRRIAGAPRCAASVCRPSAACAFCAAGTYRLSRVQAA